MNVTVFSIKIPISDKNFNFNRCFEKFISLNNFFKYYLQIIKTVEVFIFKMEISQQSRIQISSQFYDKKLHRLPVKKSNVKINN